MHLVATRAGEAKKPSIDGPCNERTAKNAKSLISMKSSVPESGSETSKCENSMEKIKQSAINVFPQTFFSFVFFFWRTAISKFEVEPKKYCETVATLVSRKKRFID
jgi:hypothetical protein